MHFSPSAMDILSLLQTEIQSPGVVANDDHQNALDQLRNK